MRHVSKYAIVFCKEDMIEILCLPAHTTHILQPLDITGLSPPWLPEWVCAGTCCSGEEAVFTPAKTCLPQSGHHLKHQGWVPQSWNLSSVQRCCGHNPGGEKASNCNSIHHSHASFCLTIQQSLHKIQFSSTSFATPHISPATPSSISSTPSATQSSIQPNDTDTTTTTPSTTQTPCPTCYRVAPKNYLVAAGVIPETLANVLMSPALERNDRVRRCIPLPVRVITSDEYIELLDKKEAEKEDNKRKRRQDGKKRGEKRDKPRRPKGRAPTVTEEDGEHCALSVQESDSNNEAITECDLCHLWFHLQEVPNEDWF